MKIKKRIIATLILLSITVLFQNFGVFSDLSVLSFAQLAPGSGGAIPGISISPHDQNHLMAATNMGTLFKSSDGGSSWTQIPNHKFSPYVSMLRPDTATSSEAKHIYYSPITWSLDDPNRLFLSGSDGFYTTRDNGDTWSHQPLITYDENGNRQVKQSPSGPYLVKFKHKLVGGKRYGFAVFKNKNHWRSEIYLTWNGGETWYKNPEINSNDDKHGSSGMLTTGFVYDNFNQGRTGSGFYGNYQFFLANKYKVMFRTGQRYRSGQQEGNPRWVWLKNGLPTEARIKGLFGASHTTQGRAIYLVTEKVRLSDNANSVHESTNKERIYKLEGNPYRPDAHRWVELFNGEGGQGMFSQHVNFGHIDVNQSDIDIAHIAYDDGLRSYGPPIGSNGFEGGVFKTDDRGRSWSEVYFRHENHNLFNTDRSWLSANNWTWMQKPKFITSALQDPNLVFLDNAGLMKSTDGGESWAHTTTGILNENNETNGNGIAVMTIWDKFKFDDLEILAATDFPLWYKNANTDWKKITHPRVTNIYSVAKVGDKIIAVGGNVHDIPMWKDLNHGFDTDEKKYRSDQNIAGVWLETDDNFESYTVKSAWDNNLPEGLPNGIYRTIFYDESSDTLYVGVFGKGIYRSVNGEAFTQIGSLGANNNIVKISKDPWERNGSIYALTTAKSRGVGCGESSLYQLSGGQWNSVSTEVTSTYMSDFTFDPNEKGSIYVTAWSCPKTKNDPLTHGGLWKRSGWSGWERLTSTGASSVSIDSNDPNKLYLSVFDTYRPQQSSNNFGVFISYNQGADWNRATNINVRAPLKVGFQGDEVYVPTFGNGVVRALNHDDPN